MLHYCEIGEVKKKKVFNEAGQVNVKLSEMRL